VQFATACVRAPLLAVAETFTDCTVVAVAAGLSELVFDPITTITLTPATCEPPVTGRAELPPPPPPPHAARSAAAHAKTSGLITLFDFCLIAFK
jgi:hypothetical protein